MESTTVISDQERELERARVTPSRTILSPGDVVAERFVIVNFLARGGMGEVYEAQDRLLQGTLIALKTISSSQAGDPAAQERFKKEVLLARQISHPNVCPIYDLFYCESSAECRCFLTMKLLRGESLASRLQRVGSLQHDEAWPIVQQIASALRAAHQAGVIHRDFKPGNIMLDGSGPAVKATVTDFGLARDAHSDSTMAAQGVVWGTRGYLAPELFHGHTASPASDLYSFGVVLQEIYTGLRPDFSPTLPTSSPSDAATRDIPRFCARLIRDCIDADPLKRCRAFDRALAVLDRKSTSGFNYGAAPALSRRNFLMGAGAGITALGATAWWRSDQLQDLLQPLPAKRFVALLSWPMPTDSRLIPLLKGALDAIESELSRAEVTDRDLLIISPRDVKVGDLSQLKNCCDSVGANLALAASISAGPAYFNVSLKLLDAATSALLRERHIAVAVDKVTAFSARTVAAAAQLLHLNGHQGKTATAAGTNSAEAFRLFQSAQTARGLLNDNGLDAAIQDFIKAIAADPRYVDAYAELALAYYRKFAMTMDAVFLDLARANAAAALRLDVRSVDAYVANAEVLAASGEPAKAIQEIAKALALDPENFRTLNSQAGIYKSLNRPADAEATYRRLLALRPNHWLTYNQLGYLLNSEGRYREALQNFRMAATLTPRAYLALNNVGALLLKFGKTQEAEDYFHRSLDAKPNDWAFYNLSLMALANGKYGEAQRNALRAVDLNPSDDTKWLQLGDSYQAAPGKAAQAHEAYLKAREVVNRRLQINGADGAAWMMLALYNAKVDLRFDPAAMVRKAQLLGASDLDSSLTNIRILELRKKREAALALTGECFERGLTATEIILVPDLASLRHDPRYPALEKIAQVLH